MPDIHGNPATTDVHSNPSDGKILGERPEDAQGNPPKDIHGNETESEPS